MRVLIVDDDAGLRHSLTLLLTEEGHETQAEGDPAEALRRAGSGSYDVILCDVRMPRMDGLTFLRRYQESRGAALLIMMSAYGAEDAALAAMREGAYDYLRKPFRAEEVTLALSKAEERERLRHEVEELRSTRSGETVRGEVISESRAMRELLDLAGRVARHNTTVLITGESGTGKEVLARAIHRLSPRSERAFTAINCAAIPELLLESELFGHVKGSFTGATADRAGLFEAADGGTLLLDEIGDLPSPLQAKLLRVLEEGEIRRVGAREDRKVDVRVIAATAKPLEAAVDQGEFRSDLFYRLNVVRLHLPPLRERPEDVPALLAHFARQAAERVGRPLSITPEALVDLTRYAWPGNVRELRNAVERASVLAAAGPLTFRDFALGELRVTAGNGTGKRSVNDSGTGNGNGNGITNGHALKGHHMNGQNGNGQLSSGQGDHGHAPARTGAAGQGYVLDTTNPHVEQSIGPFDLKSHVAAVEREVILRALEASGGNRRQAAGLLGVSLRTLFYKLRRIPAA